MGMHTEVQVQTATALFEAPRLQVQPWMRAALHAGCALPMLLMLWALLSQLEQMSWNKLGAVASWAALFVGFGWLLAHLHALASIEIGADGLAQTFVGRQGRLLLRRELRWQQVQRVLRRGPSYYFVGSDGVVLELNTMLLDNAGEKLEALHALMPQRLRRPFAG